MFVDAARQCWDQNDSKIRDHSPIRDRIGILYDDEIELPIRNRIGIQYDGIALFQSCAVGETSFETQTNGNGYFTKNFVAALSGAADSNHDGKLTLFEVCAWTTVQTQAEVEKYECRTQRPFLSFASMDFTLTEDLNVPKAKALVEEARKAMDDEKYALAVKKFDEAIALCPRINSIKRERNYANKMLKMSQKLSEFKRPATSSVKRRP